nr:oil body protein [synthetic construct]
MADTHRVDRTDRHFQFQSPYEGGRGQGQYEGDRGYGGGGYKSMMPESGPSSTQP